MRSPLRLSRRLRVIGIANFLEPGDMLAVKGLVHGDMNHPVSGRCSVPMFFTGWDPDRVTGLQFQNGAAPCLGSAGSGDNVECLAEGVRMPGRASARFERHAG